MKASNKTLLYLAGEMSPEEKIVFESELKNSQELQREILLYSNFISQVEETKNISTDENYFNSVLPEFRKRFENNISKKYSYRLAYVFPVLTILFLFFFFFFNIQNEQEPAKQNYSYGSIIENRAYNISNYTIDELIPSNLSLSDKEKYNDEFNSMIEKELDISSDSSKFYIADKVLDYNGILDNINEKEADMIYENILNKKF